MTVALQMVFAHYSQIIKISLEAKCDKSFGLDRLPLLTLLSL